MKLLKPFYSHYQNYYSSSFYYFLFFLVFSSELQQRELEAISHVRDSVQMVENAILERDQVMERRLALST